MMYLTIAATVALIFTLLRIFRPHKHSRHIDDVQLALNSRKYTWLEGLSLIPFFLFIAAIVYPVYTYAPALLKLYSPPPGALVHLHPVRSIWMLPALLLAMGLVSIPLYGLYRLILGNEYDVYTEWTNRKHGFDGAKVMKPLAIGLTTMGMLSIALLLDSSFTLTQDKLIIEDFFAINSREIQISSITEVAHFTKKVVPNGNIVDVNKFVLYSDKQEVWDSDSNVYGEKADEFTQVIDFILKKNNLTLAEKQTYE
jgi:hypothetical protein